MPNHTEASSLNSSSNLQLKHSHNNTSLFYYHFQFKKKHKETKLNFNNFYDNFDDLQTDDNHDKSVLNDINNNNTHFSSSLSSTLLLSPEIFTNQNNISNSTIYRVLIFTESFHPYTSGIARRFKEILKRLSKRKCFLIHVVTGCKV